MTVLNIREIGDPILRSKAKKVEEISEKTIEFIDNLVETMYKKDGVGLAAPQVGVLKSIFVVDVGDELIKIINPEIVSTEGNSIREEGCLSIPGKTGLVIRSEKILVQGVNTEGKKIQIEAEDLLARAIQHEIDHLKGVLFVDKVVEPEKFNKL
ncbi:MAG: peptide deformylase [Halanaerobiaceae bacterium]